MTHDCQHHGHVWLETDGTPYTRHRGRLAADVSVVCQYCPSTATLPRFAGFSGRRAAGEPVDTAIPPSIAAIVDRALEAEAHRNGTPAPKKRKPAKKATKKKPNTRPVQKKR